MGLAIFDICDTLYAANTTVEFLRFYGQRNDPALTARVTRWTQRAHAAWWIGAASHRFLGTDIAKRRIIAGLAGHSRERIERDAELFVQEALPTIANTPLLERLQSHRSDGDSVWLLSSTIAPVAEAIGRSLGVPAHGSELGYRDGKSTGRLQTDLGGQKHEWLSQRAGNVERPMSVYTDNQSDLPLIELADRATIVLPKGRTRRWAGNGHDYIQL